jgi:hypothetical protein
MSERQIVRFIGGPRDGEIHPVDVNLGAISVPDNALLPNTVRNQPRATAESTITYTKRSITVAAGEYHYFAPKDWSDERALSHLFIHR